MGGVDQMRGQGSTGVTAGRGLRAAVRESAEAGSPQRRGQDPEAVRRRGAASGARAQGVFGFGGGAGGAGRAGPALPLRGVGAQFGTTVVGGRGGGWLGGMFGSAKGGKGGGDGRSA